MRNTTLALTAVGLAFGTSAFASSPEEDQALFQSYFQERFPKVELQDFGNGMYAIDATARENWEAIEEFPPYEPAISNGQEMWETAFANGKTFADCFPDGPAVAAQYPRWDKERAMVVTLPLAVNECLEANGEKPLDYSKGPIADITAYMAYESRGQVINVEIPQDDPRAIEAFEQGKEFYFTRRGQFNFSCSHCHMGNSGSTLRTEVLSPAFGHTTHWPVYRSKWGEMGTLHRRYKGCNEQVRAAPFPLQGEEYRNLEFYMSYMDSGLELNGPGARK